MAKQLNVKLNFQADTSQAQQALAQLSTSLNQISSITPTVGTKLNSDLATAKQSALDLQRHLNNAFNAKTGNLDLSKLDASLKSSGQSLGQLSSNLLKAGSTGQTAFLSIQRAVGNASVQINQANGVLTQFWTVLKNTARWQLSSSILHGFIGGLQSAWGYAKDLDESLNNIRIVTGYSVDKMSNFAEQANKAAKALSTTTTAYTNAALIYYQQGLSDSEVLKRTDITVKMANVSRQSAEIVSDQLTAIWNNFYDGSKSLEYYADVLTALGAATASSTDEIAGGLEKFAAIGETIGLSYEYAASALATITSNTRQSEEVVGTALKTIFARIQGLNLGETLDDGTTLNKYSEALAKIGIDIFEQTGELKNMDDILDEMASKWQVLNKDQQTALAQTVAGVRQYTQLVALMDNWNKGDRDSMVANLETSYNAEGTLQKQADIYADSWEAATKRVQAAAQGIYRDLFPTEKMTGLMDGIKIVLEGIDGLVRGLGGLQGILLMMSSIALNTFKNQIGGAIDNLISKVGGGLTNAFINVSNAFKTDGILGGFKAIVGYSGNIVNQTTRLNGELRSAADTSQSVSARLALTEKAMSGSVSQALKMSMEMTKVASETGAMDAAFQQYNSNMMAINNVQSVIEKSTQYLTKEQKEQLAIMQGQVQAANEQLLSAKHLADEAERRKAALLESSGDQGSNLDRYVDSKKMAEGTAYVSDLMNTNPNIEAVKQGLNLYASVNGLSEAWSSTNAQLDVYKNHLAVAFDKTVDLSQINKDVNATYAGLVDASAEVDAAMEAWADNPEELEKALDGALKKMSNTKMGAKLADDIRGAAGGAGNLAKNAATVQKEIQNATANMHTFGVATGSSEKHMANIKDATLGSRTATQSMASAADNLNNKLAQVVGTLQSALNSAMSFGKILSNMASGFSSIAMGISAITNAIETINDEDASFTSKLTAGAMAATMGIRGLMAVLSGVSAFINSIQVATALANGVQAINNELMARKVSLSTEEGAATAAAIIVQKLGIATDKQEAAYEAALKMVKEKGVAATYKQIAADYANVASQAAKLWYITLIIAAIAALVAITWAIVTAEDAETKALKEANEQLEASKNSYDAAKEAAASFKEEVSNYQDALDGLKSLEAGSKDLAAAVEEANKKAKKLIETYGLFGKYTYGLNGEIIFDDGVLNGIQNKLNAVEKLAEIDYYGSLINQQNKQQSYDAKNIADSDVFGQYTAYRKYTTIGMGQNAYRKYGEYMTAEKAESEMAEIALSENNPNFPTEIDYKIEKITGNITGKDLQAIQEVISSLEEVPTSAEGLISAIQDMEKEAEGSSGLATYILNDIDSFINDQTFPTLMTFNDSVGEVSDACKYYAEQIAGIMTDDDYAEGITRASGGDEGLAAVMNAAKNTLLSSENGLDLGEVTLNKQNDLQKQVLDRADGKDEANYKSQYINEFVTNTLTGIEGFTDYDAWMKEHYDEIFAGSTKGYSSNLTTQDMGQAYLESQGYTITNVDNQNGKTVYSVMKNGEVMDDITYSNEIAQDLWAKQVGNYAIDQYVSDQATGILDPGKFEAMMTDIVANGEQYGADFANALVAGIANSGEFDFSSLFGELSGAEIAEMQSMDGKELASKFLGITNEDDLKELGFKSWEDFETGFKEGLDGWDPSIYADSMNSKYEAIAEANNIDVGEFKAYRSSSEARKGFENDTEENYADKWLDELEATNVEKYTEALNELAIMQTRLSRGYQTLGDNWEDWNKIMANSEASIDDINKIMPDLNDALADILNWDVADIELLPHDFAQKHWNVIQDVYNGVDGAHEKLAGLAANEYVLSLAIDTTGLDEDALAAYNTMTTWLQDMPDLEVGMSLDDTGMYDAFQALLDSGAVTVDQMNNILEQIGFSPEVEMQKIPVKSAVASADGATYTVEYLDSEGKTQTKTVSADVYHETDQGAYIEVPVINGATTKYTSGGGVKQQSPKKRGNSGGGGGGGNSKKTSDARKKRSDMGERYKEITDAIEDQVRATEKASKASDRLYGTEKLKAMRKVIAELKKEVTLLEQKRKEAEGYLEIDKDELENAAADLGYNIEYEDERISNYTSIMDDLYARREALLDSFGEEIDEGEQKALDDLDKKIERFETAVSGYDETRGIIDDLTEDAEAKMDEHMALAADELSERLELRISVDDRDLTRIEYLLSRLEDDFFNMGESAALMAGGENSQYSVSQSKLQDYKTSKEEWDTKYANGEVTAERYTQAMQELYDSIYNELGAIEEIDKAMKHYYEDTLAAAGEEIAKYTDRMSRATEVLDHYKNVLSLVGKSTDYKKMGTILEGQNTTIKNSMAAAKQTMDMYYQQAKEKEALYQQALASGNEEAAARYKLEMDAAISAAEESADEYQQLVEQLAENVNAILENTLADLRQNLEKTITGGTSFDDLLTKMDRAESLQEEYLTTTNKIYETNKLMRKAQQDIDKTTNSMAKQRLKQFINETQAMQNQTKLSNYELKLQQARYELLLAEIAVKEAQNAKSTVRLRRDSEGNFGYVYTADSSVVEEAIQQYEDTQNQLYNLSLEGANEYSRKYLETLQEMSDAFAEIERKRMEGHYATNEEYQAAMETAKTYYYKKLEDYSYLYSIALGAHANTAQDAWSTELGTMTTRTEEWKSAVDGYVKDAAQAFKDWKASMDEVESAAGIEGDLTALKNKVADVTKESDLLLKELTKPGGLLDAIKKEFTEVSSVTTAWNNQLTTLGKIKTEYDNVATSIGKVLTEMSKIPEEIPIPEVTPQRTVSNKPLADQTVVIDQSSGDENDYGTTPPGREIETETNTHTVNITPSTISIPVSKNPRVDGSAGYVTVSKGGGSTYYYQDTPQGNLDYRLRHRGQEYYISWTSYNKLKSVGFDTGGYTGSWGPDGKMAILHEKELVLNAKDTENFLASMDLLDKIIATIDLYSLNQQFTDRLNSPGLSDMNNDSVLEQQVHIEASFPSVTNHSEIEEAFNNLINISSQYANKK